MERLPANALQYRVLAHLYRDLHGKIGDHICRFVKICDGTSSRVYCLNSGTGKNFVRHASTRLYATPKQQVNMHPMMLEGANGTFLIFDLADLKYTHPHKQKKCEISRKPASHSHTGATRLLDTAYMTCDTREETG